MTTATFPQTRIKPRETSATTSNRKMLWTAVLAALVLLMLGWAATVGVTMNANMQHMQATRPALYGHVPVGPVPLPIH